MTTKPQPSKPPIDYIDAGERIDFDDHMRKHDYAFLSGFMLLSAFVGGVFVGWVLITLVEAFT